MTVDEDLDRAVEIMREHSVRRLPVVDAGHVVGIVSIEVHAGPPIGHDPSGGEGIAYAGPVC